MTRKKELSKLSNTALIVRCNTLATVAAAISAIMWLTDVRQIGSLASAAPALSLCCGLFGVVFSIWRFIRELRPVFCPLAAWAMLPVLWTIYFLLVLHPPSLRG